MCKRIAAGLGCHKNTTSVSNSLAILLSKGGILLNACMPSPLDKYESISYGYDLPLAPKCSNITGQVILKSARMPSEEYPFHSPWSIQISYHETVILCTLVIYNLLFVICSVVRTRIYSKFLEWIASTHYAPSVNCNALGAPPRNVDTSDSQLTTSCQFPWPTISLLYTYVANA